jgi:glycosyltransferase involved in cell wall biosynthesis
MIPRRQGIGMGDINNPVIPSEEGSLVSVVEEADDTIVGVRDAASEATALSAIAVRGPGSPPTDVGVYVRSPTDTELLEAINALRLSVEMSARQVGRLTAALDQAVKRLEVLHGAPAVASIAAATSGGLAKPEEGRLKRLNWVIGPADNIGWAYGNNAKRLSGRLSNYRHVIADLKPSDIAIYFDAIVADRHPVESKYSLLRIGGPRPLDRLYGEDSGALRKGLDKFDAIIALNAELYLRVSAVHPNVHLVPNGLDLKEWHPSKLKIVEGRPFTVGFAASLKSTTEAEVKGLKIAEAATARIGAKLLLTSKGKDQIPHERMIADFYSKIDALVVPVGPGREGTSNVIMEALALGIPVITTVHSGYHGEFLVNGKDALIRDRDDLMFAEALATLQRDRRLRRTISANARAFAEKHHDLSTVARQYDRIISAVVAPKPARKPAKKKISFVPFWEPMQNFGSSRLRAKYPSEFLSATGRFEINVGYDPASDIVVVVQMCDDVLMDKLRENKNQFVVYDVCDRYYENLRLFKHVSPPIDSLSRFRELVERADVVLTPSRELKTEIASRFQEKPVIYVPEPVDYGATPAPLTRTAKNTVLFFGNPDRGNFESARWMIDRLRDKHGYEPLIVSRSSFFRLYPEYQPFCRDWSMEAMDEAFRSSSLCIVAHDAAEQTKSPNRFIAAMMHGVPTLVHNSPSCSDILRETGHEFAIVKNERDLDKAINKMAPVEFRDLYLRRVQRFLNERYGQKATADSYTAVFDGSTYRRSLFTEEPRRVAFVSHNMALGEGAPWSLFELIDGLRGKGIEPFVFSAAAGPLLAQYQKVGLGVEIHDVAARHTVKVLNNQFTQTATAFNRFLKANRIEAVVCNTVKSAPYAAVARDLGIPSAVIVRESYTAPERFSHFAGEAKLAALRGLSSAEQIIFVATTSREIWADHPFQGTVRVIPNGISPARFAASGHADQAKAREALDIPQDAIVALCVGTINARKNQHEIMKAFSELPEDVRAKAYLVFLGAVENSHLVNFRLTLSELPQETRSRIRIVQATDDVADYYRAADINLMNSTSEAYPRSIVEGLYFGLPVLSTPVFGVKEQIRPRENGLLYEFGDMDAWKAAFTQLITDDDMRKQMSARAARSFWALTGYAEMLSAYKAVIASLLPN